MAEQVSPQEAWPRDLLGVARGRTHDTQRLPFPQRGRKPWPGQITALYFKTGFENAVYSNTLILYRAGHHGRQDQDEAISGGGNHTGSHFCSEVLGGGLGGGRLFLPQSPLLCALSARDIEPVRLSSAPTVISG